MRIAILGHGVEGAALQTYFEQRGNSVTFFEDFNDADIPNFQLDQFDQVFRSPSVHPQSYFNTTFTPAWDTMTNYFFRHVKAPVIGVTGTKGKGTTCSLITSILRAAGKTVYLVGNIGTPSLSELDHIQPEDVVVYEMSSFQCWDLTTSPHIAVILRIEPDHLDRHRDFDDYVQAKSHIVSSQTADDYCVYYQDNQFSRLIGALSAGHRSTYPVALPDSEASRTLESILDHLQIPGAHNRENAEAALLAVAAYFDKSLTDFLADSQLVEAAKTGLQNFTGLPHRIQFIRELNHVKYFDDNYSSAFPATDVALAAFADQPTILIAGGKNKNTDLSDLKQRIFTAPNLKKVILIGETKTLLAADEDPARYEFADTLEEAVARARTLAEQIAEDINSNYDLCIPCTPSAQSQQPATAIVLMSPGAASFDMFKNFSDRGEQFQQIVQSLN